MENLELESNQTSSTSNLKPPRRLRKVQSLKEKSKFPSIPIKGLWDQATLEEQTQAQAMAQVYMEYWMGRLTKNQACEKLKLSPLRFWQMSNQAVAGMTAGLLTQPRYRRSSFLASGDVSKLKKQVHDLEIKTTAQQKLIEILKSLPAAQTRQNATETDLDGGKKVRRAGKKKGGPKLNNIKARKPEGDRNRPQSLAENVENMEAPGEIERALPQTGAPTEGDQAS